jgi:hypothetical protein
MGLLVRGMRRKRGASQRTFYDFWSIKSENPTTLGWIRLDNAFILLSENIYIINKHNNISEQVDVTLRTCQSFNTIIQIYVQNTRTYQKREIVELVFLTLVTKLSSVTFNFRASGKLLKTLAIITLGSWAVICNVDFLLL